MKSLPRKIVQLGFDNWFFSRIDPAKLIDRQIARVKIAEIQGLMPGIRVVSLNFIRLNKESAFYEMSYLEKKRKEKKFGKFVKSVMKDKKYR